VAARLLTQWLPELNQPSGKDWPVFYIALELLLGLLDQDRSKRQWEYHK
jgi:hypothetical protein